MKLKNLLESEDKYNKNQVRTDIINALIKKFKTEYGIILSKYDINEWTDTVYFKNVKNVFNNKISEPSIEFVFELHIDLSTWYGDCYVSSFYMNFEKFNLPGKIIINDEILEYDVKKKKFK